MLTVTTDFQNKIKAPARRILGKVAIDYTNPFLDQSIAAAVNEQAAVAYPDHTYDAVGEPAFKWASLDGSWLLDGTYHLAPGSAEAAKLYQMGWWGSTLAGTAGVFSSPYPTLTVTFVSRPIHALKMVGDGKRGEYPVDFEIRLYGAGDVLKHTETVTGNTLVNWTREITSVAQVVKAVLEIRRWSQAGRQVKILEFFTSIQEVYEGDEVLLISLLEEREISAGSLPIGNISANEIDIRLSNISHKFDAGNTQSPIYELLKANRRIRAWLGVDTGGSVEYVPLGVFWSGDWQVPEDEVYAATTGRDRLELLQKSTYTVSQVAQNTNLYNLAADVFQDAGLTAEEYWIDTELQVYPVPYAWFDPMAHREALRMIAEACLGQVFCDRNGVVRIEGPSFLASERDTSHLTITRDDIFSKDNPVKWSEIANYVEVETQPLRPADSASEVYRSNEAVSIAVGETKMITAYYNNTPCIQASASLEGAPAGCTITAATYYAWGAEITVVSPTNSGTFTIVINAKPLSVLNKERAVAEDAASILDNGKLTFSFPANPLVQNLSVAQTIADTLLATFKDPRRDVELNWRGNPALELADRITAPDYLDVSTADYHVVRQSLEYDGTLTSKISGRKAR